MPDFYRPGDFYRICDVCGFEKRASETKKRWDGLIVCHDDWEPRHPQDFVKAKADRIRVPEPRGEAPDDFNGVQTTLTAAASAGATSLTVTSTTGMTAADVIGVQLENSEIHRAAIQSVGGATSLTLTSGLPFSAAIGALVIDYSTITVPSL